MWCHNPGCKERRNQRFLLKVTVALYYVYRARLLCSLLISNSEITYVTCVACLWILSWFGFIYVWDYKDLYLGFMKFNECNCWKSTFSSLIYSYQTCIISFLIFVVQFHIISNHGGFTLLSNIWSHSFIKGGV